MTDKPLTATEIKERWNKTHNLSCRCELCYVRKVVEIKQKAIFEPLIKRTLELYAKT